MKPLRVILVMQQPPLPFGGAAGRWLYVLLRGLIARGHRVTAFAACPPQDISTARPLFDKTVDLRLFPHWPRGIRKAVEGVRRPSSYLFSPQFRQELALELTGHFDVLHLEELWSGWMGLGATERAVLNVHNLYAIDLAGQPTGRLEFARLTRAERQILRRYPTLTALTPRLADELKRVSPRARVTTTPLGLALDQYQFLEPTERVRPTVGLIGSFSWAPTRSAAERLVNRLWPEIKRRVPGVRLQLVGRRAEALLGGRPAEPAVSVAADVPDIVPYFRGLDVLLYAPAHATGVKVKVLEAMAFGVPVVTNPEGLEGIPGADGVHVGLAENDEDLIARTVALLTDVGRRIRQAAAARTLLEQHCSGEIALDATEAHYRTMLAGAIERPPAS